MPPPPARPTVVVPIVLVSDGDASQRPAAHFTQDTNATLARERLALNWMKDRGEARLGVNYILDQMPAGYTFWGRPRASQPKHVDKYIYGHPSGKSYDSPNRFYPHFLHLMRHGNASGCSCVNCTGPPPKVKAPGEITDARSYQVPDALGDVPRRGRPPGLGKPLAMAVAVDDEGSPDVYRLFFNRLQRNGKLQEDVAESMSMDWRVERKLLHASTGKLQKQSRWIPRLGEVVIYIRDIGEDDEILLDENSAQYTFYSNSAKKLQTPIWEAGIVTQVPEESLREEDLIKPQRKHADVNYSGFRVGPLPDPNNADKALSKRHKYAPLAHLRPFVFHEELLVGVPVENWHETINNARKIMSTVTLVGRYHFSGVWPQAKLNCRSVYIGSELITVGDYVRLFPKEDGDLATSPIDIMEVTEIYLKFWDLDKASGNDNDGARPYQSAIRIKGRCWTPQQQTPASSFTSVNARSEATAPKALQDYGKYRLKHSTKQKMEIPFNRVISRAYEAAALGLWFPSADPTSSFHIDQPPDLTLGINGVRNARDYSSTKLRAITDDPVSGRRWFWADTRVEALDLVIVNGQEVALFDGERDPKAWRRALKIMDGTVQARDLPPVITSPIKRFSMAVPGSGNTMVRSAVEVMESDEEKDEEMMWMAGTVDSVEGTEAAVGRSAKTGPKRSFLESFRNNEFSARKRSRSGKESEASDLEMF